MLQARAKGGKRPRSISEREAKRMKKNAVEQPRNERDKDTIREYPPSWLESVANDVSRGGRAQL